MKDITKKHLGSCHCGAVRFCVSIAADAAMSRCNCSICHKLGASGVIVKPDAFTLLAGDAALRSYEWGAKISKRYFCGTCGVFCYGAGYLAEVGGDFVSVNCNALDDLEPSERSVVYWDGRHDNWMAGPRDTPFPLHRAESAAS